MQATRRAIGWCQTLFRRRRCYPSEAGLRSSSSDGIMPQSERVWVAHPTSLSAPSISCLRPRTAAVSLERIAVRLMLNFSVSLLYPDGSDKVNGKLKAGTVGATGAYSS